MIPTTIQGPAHIEVRHLRFVLLDCGARLPDPATAMDDVNIKIDQIYIPARRHGDVDSEVVNAIAESIMEIGLQVPISVRRGDERYVLVTGLQRLEACKALGEDTITAIIVSAPQH
jgi:uncharacterized ParB-like nuclease family protein